MTYSDSPRILKWEDSICKHPKVMFNMCHECKEKFEGYSKETHEAYLTCIGFSQEHIKEIIG